jgi:glycogen debranching enzyme
MVGKSEREQEQKPNSHQNVKNRKKKVLSQWTASVTQSIANAVVAKDGNVFFLTEQDGDVPMQGQHGFGLYYHDCRYLDGYELRLAGKPSNVLVSDASEGFRAVFELANPDLTFDNNGQSKHVAADQVGIKWERLVDGKDLILDDVLTFRNYGQVEVEFPLAFYFRAQFEDVFNIRGLLDKHPGELKDPQWQNGALHFLYIGADDIYRRLSVHFSPQPDSTGKAKAEFSIKLKPGETRKLMVKFVISESKDQQQISQRQDVEIDPQEIAKDLKKTTDEWLKSHTSVKSESLLFNSMIERSLCDLQTLRTHIGDEDFYAAGVPWFVTLFGRDSIITAMQTLSYNPEIAEETLRLLAKYQGDQVDDWRDEQPGKILHELRIGELANIKAVPHTPYYGTIDATPLFLVLLARHAHWTGDLSLFHDLKDNVELALDWMDKYGDLNGDGYIEYDSPTNGRLINQGWKDSGTAIVTKEGDLATPPIALVEVQAYAYMAGNAIAELYELDGNQEKADQLRQQAQALRTRFNKDFWMEEEGFFVLGLQDNGKPIRVISSNPGHGLWAGIIDSDKATSVVQRLFKSDMYNGWGIRTLSSDNARYNPTGYHLGTVWPHDNAIIAAGFRKYGFDDEARKLFHGLIEAAMNFDAYRLPELFSGFDRQDYNVPVHYPTACHPQAWAACSIPYSTRVLLGLEPQAFKNRLQVVKPMLPDFIDRLNVRELRVAQSKVDLDFDRNPDGSVRVEVVKVDGDLDVEIEA